MEYKSTVIKTDILIDFNWYINGIVTDILLELTDILLEL